MKYLLIIVLVAGSYYFFQKESSPDFDSWVEVIDKVRTEGATNGDIKFGLDLLAKSVCSDKVFQESLGATVESCNQAYLAIKDECEKETLTNLPDVVSSQEIAQKFSKKYMICLNIF